MQTLRAQVASLTNGAGFPDLATALPTPTSTAHVPLPKPSPTLSTPGTSAVPSFARSDLMIDPSLQNEGPDQALRSPWDSPSFFSGRRHSDFPFPPTPNGVTGSEAPRSPYFGRPYNQQGATSLTRMVHDAALRTGHAQNNSAVVLNPPPASIAGSEKGSTDSPVGDNGDTLSPNDPLGLNKRLPTASSPLATSASVSSKGSKRRAGFSVPPLPPQPAVERLVAAYVDFVGVTAPIIHIPTLGKQLIKIRNNTDVEQSDVFVVMMVLGKLHTGVVLSEADFQP